MTSTRVELAVPRAVTSLASGESFCFNIKQKELTNTETQEQWHWHKETPLQVVVMETTTRTTTTRMPNNCHMDMVVGAMGKDDSVAMVEVKGLVMDIQQ